jgi:hypothetical protein
MSGAGSNDEPEGAPTGGSTDGKVQPRGQGKKLESAEDTEPTVAAPKTKEAPKIGSGASESSGSSPFDSSWDGLLGEGKPKAPDAPLFAPPGASKTPETKPRTSEGSPAVSGEFGELDKPAEAKSAKPEPEKTDDEPAKTKDEPEKAEPEKDEPEPEKADDDPEKDEPEKDEPETADDEPEKADDEPEKDEPGGEKQADDEPPEAAGGPGTARAKPNEGGPGLGTILAIAFAILLIFLFIYNSRERSQQEGSPGPSKPNQAAKEQPAAPKPQPRPPKAKTHAADPALEALRAREQGTSDTDGGEAGDAETETAGAETGEPLEAPEPAPTPAKVDDPRDPSLIPPGTPEENAKAFIKLPVSLHDGPPLGSIGRSGIHVDAIAMSRGRDNSECDDPTRSFTVSGAEFINVCFRVVHPRAQETLRVVWEKDGAVTRRGKVRIPENLHAYKTRAYLQVRPEYVGSWRVRIVPEGEEDTDLAVAEFEIQE